MSACRRRRRKITHDRNEHGTSSCLITDVQMPGMSGADLQAQLIAEGNFTPIIFMTAFDNENIRARTGQTLRHFVYKSDDYRN
ncbi:MAG: response regulator [Pseudolabrys sp.]